MQYAKCAVCVCLLVFKCKAKSRTEHAEGKASCGLILNALRDITYVWQSAEVALRAQWLFRNNRTSTYCKSFSVTLFTDQNLLDTLLKFLKLNRYSLFDIGFDSIQPYGEDPHLNKMHPPAVWRIIHKGSPDTWYQRMWALEHARSDFTMMLDADAYPCTGFDQLFDVLVTHDVAATLAPSPFGGSLKNNTHPQPPGLSDNELGLWSKFPERNLGLLLVATSRPVVASLLGEFKSAFLREMHNVMLAPVNGDQTAWREALFVHRSRVVESIIPERIGCRRGNMSCETCSVVHPVRKLNLKYAPKFIHVLGDKIKVKPHEVEPWNCCESNGLQKRPAR